MNGNRSPLWALLGVLIGFSLPALACIGLILAFSLGLASLGEQAQPTNSLAVHVSGPTTGPAIAVIDINGPIVSGRAQTFGASTVAATGDILDLVDQATLDRDVRAILLVVNSPGGGVVASDQLYHALSEVPIPIIVLMEDVAASGAYLLSMAADQIIANPNTLTGSIGVIITFPEASELLEKIGLQFNVITAGEVKDIGSPYRPMSTEEQEYWEEVTNEVYLDFVQVVAVEREMAEADVLDLADGRAYTGRRALELGLVDALGYESDALAAAADLGGITAEPRVIRYQKFSPLSSLLGGSVSLADTALPADWLWRALGPSLEYRLLR